MPENRFAEKPMPAQGARPMAGLRSGPALNSQEASIRHFAGSPRRPGGPVEPVTRHGLHLAEPRAFPARALAELETRPANVSAATGPPTANPASTPAADMLKPGLEVLTLGPDRDEAQSVRVQAKGRVLILSCEMAEPPSSAAGRELVAVSGHDFEMALAPGVARIVLAVSAFLVEPLLNNEGDADLARLLAVAESFKEYSSKALSADKRLVARQILSCPLLGSWRRMFLEGKAHELMALFLAGAGGASAQSSGVSPGDLRKLSLAREILISSLSSPPSLKTLARSCGLNENKVKRGFRECFGESVGSFLRRERMALAMELLSRTEKSVGLVANCVGYASSSHFIEAFRREFGHTPGRVRRLKEKPADGKRLFLAGFNGADNFHGASCFMARG